MVKKTCECGQEFVFLKNFQTGKTIPVNLETITEEEKKGLEAGLQVGFNGKHHINHFADCPNRDKFRKG